MGTEVIPPKRTNYVGMLAILLGAFLAIWGTYKLYIQYGPTLQSRLIEPPTLEKNTIYDNTDMVTIKGEATPNAYVIIEEAGQILKKVATDETGFFNATLKLSEGTHKLALYTTKTKILKLRSSLINITVNVDKTRPTIKKVKYPQKLQGTTLQLEGTLSEPAKLIIQAGDSRIWEKELPAGNFKVKAQLKNLNSTKLYVYAIDKAGNVSKSQEIKIALPQAVLSKQARKTVQAKQLPNSAGILDLAVSSITKSFATLYFLALTMLGYLGSLFITKTFKKH